MERPLRAGEWDAFSGVASAQGPRPTMEDRHTNADEGWCIKQRKLIGSDGWPRCAFYGVFDGHGGSRVATVASTTLWKHVQEGLALKLGAGVLPVLEPPASRVGASSPVVAAASPVVAEADSSAPAVDGDAKDGNAALPTQEELVELVENAFELTEAEVLNQAKKGRWEDGCTAVTALLFDGLMITGNLGDSRAVLCSRGKAVRLTQDHKPNTPSELARISAAGGFVKTIMGIARLGGDLSLSRAFGDQSFKKAVKPRGASPPPRSSPARGVGASSPPPRGFQRAVSSASETVPSVSPVPASSPARPPAFYVRDGPLSAIPDVKVRALDPADEFVILACDGVWDVFSDEQAVKHVQMGLKEAQGDPYSAGQFLVDKVLRSGRCTDNVTACVVVLRWGAAA